MFGQFMSTHSSLVWECLGGAYMVISFNLNTKMQKHARLSQGHGNGFRWPVSDGQPRHVKRRDPSDASLKKSRLCWCRN